MIQKSSTNLPVKLFKLQSGWIIFLFLTHLITQSRNVLTGRSLEAVQGSLQIFNLDNEANLPAWYSSCALFVCALLLGIIAASSAKTGRKKTRNSWFGLSLIFMLLSLDEAISIHEEIIPGILRRIDSLPFSNGYDWTVLGGLCFIGVVAGYFRFWWRLPSVTRYMFAIAAVIFVGGAIGFEKISHFYEAKYQTENTIAYVVTCGIEELLEMMGIALFTYGLLDYITQHVVEQISFFGADSDGFAAGFAGADSLSHPQQGHAGLTKKRSKTTQV
ncbi:MAG: hypothetical protein ACFB2W_18465 [Leptolyngbyaceae cyanobacterium]